MRQVHYPARLPRRRQQTKHVAQHGQLAGGIERPTEGMTDRHVNEGGPRRTVELQYVVHHADEDGRQALALDAPGYQPDGLMVARSARHEEDGVGALLAAAPRQILRDLAQ